MVGFTIGSAYFVAGSYSEDEKATQPIQHRRSVTFTQKLSLDDLESGAAGHNSIPFAKSSSQKLPLSMDKRNNNGKQQQQGKGAVSKKAKSLGDMKMSTSTPASTLGRAATGAEVTNPLLKASHPQKGKPDLAKPASH